MARKRRGRSEGSIFQRADGQWVGSISLGYDGNGKRKRRTVYGATKAQVQEKLRKLQGDAFAGMVTDPQRQRLSEYLAYWLENIVRPNRSLNTYTSYEGVIRNHITPLIGGTQLAQLTGDHVQALYGAMAKAGVSDRTRQLAHAVLHRALQVAVEAKPPKIPFNPCDYVEAPRLPEGKVHRVEPYGAEEVRRLLAAAEGHRLEALIVLAVFTGMRQGELFALQWPDLDLETGALCVRHSLEEVGGKLALKEPKSGKARRVELPPLAVAALWGHRARMLTEGHLDGPVFCDTRGGWLRKSNFLRNVFQPLIKKAGLPRRRFHDLRHTSATLLLTLGVHPKVVQERLGHSKINVTLDTYSHVAPTLQKEAAAKLDGLFRQSG
jgi:integrase